MGIHEEKDNVIKVVDEEGAELELEILDIIDFEGDEYLVLISTDEDADEIHILVVEEDEDGEEIYSTVEDEEVMETVFEIFKNRFPELFQD